MVADVTVIGTGIIALTSAIELADRGLSVRLVGTMHSGNASSAAGGMLAPSVGRKAGSVQAFAETSRDRYPGFVAALSERTGRHIPLNTEGIFEIALTESDVVALGRSFESPSRWVSPSEIAIEEPTVTQGLGGVYHPLDGCVEPLPLLDALSIIVARHNSITTVREDCRELHSNELGCSIRTNMESRIASSYVVLAAGAWTPLIAGSGQIAENVKPVRGQMLALERAPVRHVICGAGGYLIPRSGGVTIVGGTMEDVGFNATTTPSGLEMMQSRAVTLCSALGGAPIHSSWAGLRPVTPDLMPIIGADPTRPRVIYACGHSRNGILLAPLTAESIGDIVCGTAPHHDLSQFRPGRH